MLTYLLSLDTSLLIFARGLVTPEYARIVQILGESVVIWCMLLLIGIWIKWVISKNENLKLIALQIFFTIILVFFIYAMVNFGIPKWRPSPQDVVGWIAPLIPHPIDNSFPSGHALFSGALLVGLWKYYRHNWIITITSIIALATLSARVIGWVHYPGDIIGGLILGVFGWILLRSVVSAPWMKRSVYERVISIMKWLKL